jgi:hypothetical protein
MSTHQTLQNEIEDSKSWIEVEKDDSTYKRDLQKRIAARLERDGNKT